MMQVVALCILLAVVAAPRTTIPERPAPVVEKKPAVQEAKEWFDKASKYSAERQDDLAVAAYTKAIERHPQFVEAYSGRGSVLMRMGRTEQALDDFDRAIALDRTNPVAYNNRATLLYNRGAYAQAVEDLTRALAIEPGKTVYHANRGAAYLKLKQHEKAIVDYTRVIANEPKNGDGYTGRGTAYYSLGKRGAARVDFEKACKLGNETGCRNLEKLKKWQ